jgi:S-adenosylmethionine decarboxylase proenzyme
LNTTTLSPKAHTFLDAATATELMDARHGATPSKPKAFAQPAPNLGKHLLVEFFDCDPNVLNNNALVEQRMIEAAHACKATIVETCFHHFSPYGVSGVIVIEESHFTIHTWPEYGYASVDLYTCGDLCDPVSGFNYLQDAFMAKHSSFIEFKRGLMNPSTGEMLKMPAMQVGEPITRELPSRQTV